MTAAEGAAAPKQGNFDMKEVLGDYIEMSPNPEEFLDIRISMSSESEESDWQKNSLCAEFIAKYMTSVIISYKDKVTTPPDDMSDAINYIANELFENAAKFNQPATNKILSFQANKDQNSLRFYIRNSIDANTVGSFQELIEKLLSEDPEQLYFERMEAIAEDPDANSSGLGYLSVMVDYSAEIAWKFERMDEAPETVFVTTMIVIGV